jgi:hypothetical protein
MSNFNQLNSQMPNRDLMIIAFCVPCLGIVLYLLNRKSMPYKAKVIIYCAGLGYVIRLILNYCYVLSLPVL